MKTRWGFFISAFKTAVCLFFSFFGIGALANTAKAEEAAVSADRFIILNEICPFSDPDCEGGEWIELANTSDDSVNLNGYTLSDANIEEKFGSEDYAPVELDGLVIDANGLLLLTRQAGDFAFAINDTDESIVLREKGDIVDRFGYGAQDLSYPNLKKGQSYARSSSGWLVASKPSPGALNTFEEELAVEQTEPLDIPEDISQARDRADKEKVVVEGTVSVLPGALSFQYFYIQDEASGIQVYCYEEDFPDLMIGDKVVVKGELASISNERRIKIHTKYDITVKSSGNPPLPAKTEVSEIGEDLEGVYMKTKGTVIETAGTSFVISDGRGEVEVNIRSGTKIQKPKMRKGDEVEISGIVSQYKDEYRILPFKQEDVRIINSIGTEELPETGFNWFFYPLAALCVQIIWNIFQQAKKKLRKLQKKFLLILHMEMFLP